MLTYGIHLHGDVLIGIEVDASVVAGKDLVDFRLARLIGGKRVLLPVAVAASAPAPATTFTVKYQKIAARMVLDLTSHFRVLLGGRWSSRWSVQRMASRKEHGSNAHMSATCFTGRQDQREMCTMGTPTEQDEHQVQADQHYKATSLKISSGWSRARTNIRIAAHRGCHRPDSRPGHLRHRKRALPTRHHHPQEGHRPAARNPLRMQVDLRSLHLKGAAEADHSCSASSRSDRFSIRTRCTKAGKDGGDTGQRQQCRCTDAPQVRRDVPAHALARRIITTRQRLLLWHCLCKIVVLLLGLLIPPLHRCCRFGCTLMNARCLLQGQRLNVKDLKW